MKRSAAGVDIAPVGQVVHCDYLSPERSKQRRSERACGAISAIEHDLETRKARPGDQAAAQEFEIIFVELPVRRKRGLWNGCTAVGRAQDFRRDLFRRKTFFADQTGDARRGDYAGKRAMNAFFGKSGHNFRGDMSTRFAGIGANQHARVLVPETKVASNAAADPVQSCIIQGIFARYAADAVSSKELFRHFEKSRPANSGSGRGESY
jgi:hypothetical protein